jgi:homoserine O-acetyltransferase
MKKVAAPVRMAMAVAVLPAAAAAPALAGQGPQQGDFTIHNFRFHDGAVLPELRQHYTTLGDPKSPAVLVLHGTGGTGSGMLNPRFGGELFGPGQPLDASRYFIILPDSIGAGKSSKPSDGLRMKFPRYNYDDMVAAQYRLLTEGLHIHHLRLVFGNSMGGMMSWTWAAAYPGFMDAAAPLASQPVMAARNWMLRRMLVETIKADPAWHGGDYASQPPMLKIAQVTFGLATSGGTLAWQQRAPSRAAADAIVDAQLAAPHSGDANDTIYQFEASRDYDVVPRLGRIKAWVLAINSADDERNPNETGTSVDALKRLAHGSLYLIPASTATRGHGTTGNAAFWKSRLKSWLATVPADR